MDSRFRGNDKAKAGVHVLPTQPLDFVATLIYGTYGLTDGHILGILRALPCVFSFSLTDQEEQQETGAMQDENESTTKEHSAAAQQDRMDALAAPRQPPASTEGQRIAELEAAEAEHARTEEAIRQSEERFRALVQNSSDVILLLDADGTVHYVSPSAKWILGYAPEQILGQNLFDYAHPADQAAARENLTLAMRRPGTSFVHEFRLLHADGSWIYLETVTNSLLNQPTVRAIVVNARDITKRKRTEQALRESEARFRGVVEDQTEFIVRWKPDGTHTFVNEAYCRYFERSREQLIGTSFLDLTAEEGQQTMLQRIARLNPADPVAVYLHRQTRPDGTPGWLEWTVRALFDEDGRLVELQSVGRDVTQRKEMEQERESLLAAEREQRRLAEALRQAAAAVSRTLELDQVLDGILAQVTRVIPGDATKILLIEHGEARAVRWRGYERFAIDDRIASLALPVADMQALRQMQETGRPIFIPDTHAYAGWLRLPELEWLRSYVAAPIRARPKGGVPAVIGFLTVDSATPGFFTAAHADRLQTFADQASLAIQNARLYEDLQRQMQELRSAQAQLVQSAKMAAIGELAAGVAHELNNPLTSILGFSELLLRDTATDDPARNDLVIIAEQARRARDIVRDLLTFARQTGSVLEPTDLNQVLQQALSLIRRQIEMRRVNLEESYAADLPCIPLDASRLKQVFLNLVTNALDAMPQGGTLAISTRRAGDEVAVRFADTGSGIPQDHLGRIFEPFFTTKPTRRGTGLGLSVSLGIVQEHGGRIDFESQEGEGSTFTVWLPDERADASSPPSRPDVRDPHKEP
jgi:PAS domain S-box-containing protein